MTQQTALNSFCICKLYLQSPISACNGHHQSMENMQWCIQQGYVSEKANKRTLWLVSLNNATLIGLDRKLSTFNTTSIESGNKYNNGSFILLDKGIDNVSTVMKGNV